MKKDVVYVRGVWVPMGHERINEVLQIRDPKNGSKYKKLIKEPNHEKIVDFLTGRKGKWNSTKKNPHESIPRGSLIEESKVWFYFITSVIIPTKHLCTIRENEAIILYALLKGCKFDMGKIIKTFIKTFHKIVKRGLIPHPAIITKLCILAGVKGVWVEEETCPRTSPLTLSGVFKGPKSRKMKEMEIVEVAEEPQEEEEGQVEIEQFPGESQLLVEDEFQSRISPVFQSPPHIRENFSKPAECSKGNTGNKEIMEMLVSMKKEMEEREKKWEQQQRIREEFLEADFKRREQRWEQLLKQREEEWKEEIERRERVLMQRLESKIQSFYDEKLKRNEDVLTFLDKREEKLEESMLQKAEGFKYLYKEQFKEFGNLMEKRDKEMEMDNNYRQKLWNDSLDKMNSNLVNMHIMLIEL